VARQRLLIAHVATDPARRAAVLAALLAFGPDVSLPGIPAATADDLWAAWREQGRAVANRRGLLFGDHDAWLAAAAESPARKKRALLATLAREADDPAVRSEAHRRLAITLLEANDGRLLERLYTEAAAFGDADAIPRPIRYTLADRFVDAGRLEEAGRLFIGLEPPSRGDATPWRLRQARVLVLAGEADAGADALHALLDEAASLEQQTLDRALQIAFDLQGAGAHAEALTLFDRLYRRAHQPRTEREIRFWMGESHRERGDHAAAAAAYLRAARHIPDDLDDPWVETAYYRAARSLARGGFTDDARALYQRLLQATDGSRREALLRNELRRLSREGQRPEESGRGE
jgi:tetratricopeptide (TPR) repeat protein